MYEWSKDYELGINFIDEQHKSFFDLTNKFVKSFENNQEHHLSLDALEFLENYLRKHFSTEEFYLKKYNYPELEMHIKHHKNFIQNLENFKNKYRRSGLGKMAVEELRGFMLDVAAKSLGEVIIVSHSSSKFSRFNSLISKSITLNFDT